MIFSLSNSKIIEACGDGCGFCSNAADDSCTSCNKGTFLHQNTCITTCPDRYYQNAAADTCDGKLIRFLSS